MDSTRLKQLVALNTQLLETTIHILHKVDDYCKKHDIPLPMEDNLIYLVKHAINLIEEINEEIPLPPKWKHRFRTPKDSTEPFFYTNAFVGLWG